MATRLDDERLDDVSSAPESGTVRGETSGNNPAHGGEPIRAGEKPERTKHGSSDDTSSAPESGTER